MTTRKVLAIIPARGGSKGIPGKNILPLGGKPLLAHSIDQAKRTPAITRVVVSTDDDQIARVARAYGAETIARPPEISGDAASSESALLHALDFLRASEGYEPDLVVFLQATSPLRGPGDIGNALETFDREHADSLLSVCPLHGFVWRRTPEGIRSFSYDYKNRQRRQDAPEDFVENGSLYIFKPRVLRESGNRLGGTIALYPMAVLDSFQIDEPGDFQLMEALLAARQAATAPALASIKLLILDFDGVMTDNRVLVSQDGAESVLCSRSDGWGIARLREAGVGVMVLSTEQNPVVTARCTKLGIACVQGSDDKLAALQSLAAERGLAREQIAYLGNDVNDLGCLAWVGCPIAVRDAHPAAQAAACWVTRHRGGRGAVREVCDAILNAGSPNGETK